ncbi:MAG: ABC transporter permease [Arcanobacterium sp.]|nr:ABC transporter permease [Arcanobacterium sp.]
MDILLSALSQGAIWTIMGIGVYITFRVLNEADLTTESSFTLGAATGAQLLLLGMHPLLAGLVALLMGAAAGAVTALLITRVHINSLLAGIITMTGLYSVNLVFLGRANISISSQFTLKSMISGLHLPRNVDTLLIGIVVILVVVVILGLFFRTDMGQALIATGDNPVMANALGIPSAEMMMLGYMMGNGLIALSGYLVATDNGYADISMGVGSIVIGLAAIIIGEVLVKNVSLPVRLLTIFLGSVVYRLLLAGVLMLKINTDHFKLFSAIILGLCLSIPALQQYSRRLQTRRVQRKLFTPEVTPSAPVVASASGASSAADIPDATNVSDLSGIAGPQANAQGTARANAEKVQSTADVKESTEGRAQ